MKLLRVLAITRIYSSWFLSSKLWLINQLVLPFSIYIVYVLAIGGGFELYALIGSLVSLSWNAGANAISQQLFSYRYIYRIKDIFVTSPLTSLEFAFGCGIGGLINAALPALPIFALMTIYVGVRVSYALLVFLFSWLLGTVFGFWVGSYAKDPAKLGALSNFLYYVLTLLPPVYYPVKLLPEWIGYAALSIPTVSLASALSGMLNLDGAQLLVISFLVLLSYLLLFTVIAVKYSEWSES